jgi:hypothetical protein
MISSHSRPKRLLTIEPGLYFKVADNERKTLTEATTGLLVSSYSSQMTGETVYNVVLVDGELLLIPQGKE